MAAPTIEIAGIDRTEWLATNSLRISRPINGRARCNAVLRDRGRGYVPHIGNTLVVLQSGTKRFAGNIRSKVSRAIPVGVGAQCSFVLEYTLEVLDYNSILDKRRVLAEYPAGMTLGAIVSDIVTNFLDGEGVTTSNVATGPTILEPLRFNLNNVNECFTKLSQISGNYGAPFLFYVDFDKDLHFSQFTSNPAPFSLTDTSDNFRDLEISEDLDNYRNDQWVRSEWSEGAIAQESFTGDGSTTSFPTSGIITATPTVEVNGVQGTVGELGVDNTGKDWYWIRDGFGIFNQDHAVLTGADTLTVGYPSSAPNIARADDAAEIAIRAAAEGNSGRYQAVDEQKNINSFNTLQAIARGDLTQWGTVPTKATFTVFRGDAEPGQHVTINLTRHGINAAFFIEQLDLEWVAAYRGGRADFFKCRIRGTSVAQFGMRTGYFEKLTEMARIGSDPGTITGEQTPVVTGCAAWGETPLGTMDGSNVTFTLVDAPAPASSLVLAVNGVVQRQGTDYTLSGNAITYASALASTDQHRAWYGFSYAQNSEIPSSISPAAGTFLLSQTPTPGASLILALNGAIQAPSTDFSLSTATIDYVNAPDSDDWQRAWYGISDTGILVYGETPTGTINGSNKNFVLANAASCVFLVRNGIIQFEGIDFVLNPTPSGTTIDYLVAPQVSDWHLIWYKL